MDKKTVIITAGGIGKRMESDLPKQFLLLDGKAILVHCVEQFYSYDSEIQIIITLPTSWISYWEKLCLSSNFKIKHILVDGGVERYDSIKNALEKANGQLIAIHDGVRPLVSVKLIQEGFELAEEMGSAIPVAPIKESIRFVDKGENKSLNRAHYFTVQTPQIFQEAILRKAYQIPFHSAITDDASLVEESGVDLSLFTGEERNIKITTPMDLKIAELLLTGKDSF